MAENTNKQIHTYLIKVTAGSESGVTWLGKFLGSPTAPSLMLLIMQFEN